MSRKHPDQPRGGLQAVAGAREAWPLAARIRAEAGSTRVDVYDDIGGDDWSGGGVSAKDFAVQMAAVTGPVSCHINSAGGDVFDGLAIFNALKAHAGPVTTVVDGLAASIASVIFQAGDDRVMAPGSMTMIHDAFGVAVGNAAELAKMSQTLDQVSANLAGVYAQRCGGTADGWRDAMKAETWYAADEAVSAGLADRVSGQVAQLPASVGVAAAGTVPGRIAARLRSMPQAAALRSAGPPRATLDVVGGGRAERPAEQLDRFPWARSWGSFLAAVRDPGDKQGARKAIAAAMASRPRNDMGERVPSEGGFLVPSQLVGQIIAYMQTGIIRPRCTLVPMSAYRVGIPVLDNASQASGAQALGGMTWDFTPEGETITATRPLFGRVALEAWPDKARIAAIPNELLQDATSFTEDFLPRIVAMGLSWHVDDVVLYQGSGAGEPEALVNALGQVTVARAVSDEVAHADVVGMLKALHPASKATATWLASEDVFDQLLELYEVIGTAPSGQQIPPPGTLKYNSDSRRWELLGLEIIPNDHQPAAGTTGDLMLADLAQLLLGELGEMTVDVSSKGSGFVMDTSDIRFRFRWDSRFWLQEPVTLANGKVTSPLVVLQ